MSEDIGGNANNMYIWGTNLDVTDVQKRIGSFMRSFTLEDSNDALYVTLIKQVKFYNANFPAWKSLHQQTSKLHQCMAALQLYARMKKAVCLGMTLCA